MKDLIGPCSKPWSTGKITNFPVPANFPDISNLLMFPKVPGFSEEYHDNISDTFLVSVMFTLLSLFALIS